MRELLVVLVGYISEGEGKFLHTNSLRCPYFSSV